MEEIHPGVELHSLPSSENNETDELSSVLSEKENILSIIKQIDPPEVLFDKSYSYSINDRRKYILNQLKSFEILVKSITNSDLPSLQESNTNSIINRPIETRPIENISYQSEIRNGKSLLYSTVLQIKAFLDNKYTSTIILNEIHRCAGDIQEAVLNLCKENYHNGKSSLFSLNSVTHKGEILDRYIDRVPSKQ